MKRPGWYRRLGRSGWLPFIGVVLAVGVSEWHRWADENTKRREIADDTVRRIVRQIDYVSLQAEVGLAWMELASPKIGVNPPMRLPRNQAWPMENKLYTPATPPGLYAGELPPREVP